VPYWWDRPAGQRPSEPEEPEPSHKLDIRPLTLADLDWRVGEWLAAEREYLHELLAQLLAEIPTAERGERGPPGFLPIVKTWQHDAIFYTGDVVAFDGSTWQATKDTAQAPGTGADWQLLARGGSDAFRPQVRGTYSAEKKYRCLDIVARDGSSFIARRDFPGACSGEDWQLLAGAYGLCLSAFSRRRRMADEVDRNFGAVERLQAAPRSAIGDELEAFSQF
jgi:hypothetical protein